MQVSDNASGASAATAAVEIYSVGQSAYAQPRRFVDMLDRWGDRLAGLAPRERVALNQQLETLLEGGEALLEAGRTAVWLDDELEERLAMTDRPAAAFNARGGFLASNAQASEQLGLGKGQRLADRAWNAAEAERIEKIMREAPDAAIDRPVSAVVALEGVDGAPLLYELTPVYAVDSGATQVLATGMELRVSDDAMAALERVHKLTEAETAIARLTLEGIAATEIAARRNTSIETVRTQIKSLREKTGVRSQLELQRLVAGLSAARATPDPRRAGEAEYAMPRRHAIAQLSNGRRIEYVAMGPAGGRPIIVLHAVLFGFHWPAELTDALTAAGCTLYFPVRPGYGLSSGVTPGAIGYEEEVDDLADFVDRLGLESYSIVSQGVSAGVGAALARRHHNRVCSMAAISGYLPVDAEEFFADMSAWQRTVLHVARSAPRLMQFTSRLAARMIRKIGAAEFYAKTFSNSPSDMAIARDAGSLELLESSLRLLRAQRLAGLNNDFPRVMLDWTESWNALRTPTLQIHGGQKQVIAPDRAEAMCARHPAARFELIADGGQMLAYSHPRKVATLLLQHFASVDARSRR